VNKVWVGVLLAAAASSLTAEQPYSPRLRTVLAATDRPAALPAFWKEVEAKGAPLIEPASGSGFPHFDRGIPLRVPEAPEENDAEYSLVTFLWRSSNANEHVLIVGIAPPGQTVERMTMQRLGDTDVWYQTYRLRNDARFTYELSVNDPDVTRADPLNPKHWDVLKPRILSLVELPSAPPLPPLSTNVIGAFGDLIESKILGNKRHVFVQFPQAYKESAARFPLIVLPIGFRNMVDEKVPAVVVFIEFVDQAREGGCDPKYADFLAEELLPFVRARARVSSDPAQVIIGGASAAGLNAACTAFRHPEAFGNVLAEDGAFWRSAKNDPEDEWFTRRVAAEPKKPTRFYLSIGLLEYGTSFEEGTVSMVAANRHLRDVLIAKGYSVRYDEVMGAHDPFNWRAMLPKGLAYLLSSIH